MDSLRTKARAENQTGRIHGPGRRKLSNWIMSNRGLRPVSQSSDEALAAPKLDIVTVDQTLGLLDGFGIIRANQRLRADKMPVAPDDKRPVLYHPAPSSHRRLKTAMPPVELQSAHRFIAVSARNRTLDRAREAATVRSAEAVGDPGSRRQLNHRRRPPTAAGLLPVLQDAIDFILDQPDGRRPAYRTDSGFAFAVTKSEFPPPPSAIRQLNDGIFDAFIFHQISTQNDAYEGPRAACFCAT
jgi:hypothetical protein